MSTKIIELRSEAKMSNLELANALGVSLKSVNSRERKMSFPSLINIIKICNLFDIKMDELVIHENLSNRNLNML